MRLRRARIEPLGPLPQVEFEADNLMLILDLNDRGKTTLVDGLVQLLFGGGRSEPFPDAKRFDKKAEGEVEVEVGGKTKILTGGQSLGELLGFSHPHFARLLCIRAGELNLSASEQVFPQLMDALSATLAELELSPHQAICWALDEAHLTERRRTWSDAQPHRTASEVHNTLGRLQKLHTVVDIAFAVEEKERLVKSKEEEIERSNEVLRELNRQISKTELLMEAQRYHSAKKHHKEWGRLRQEIQQNYARYWGEDLSEWEQCERDSETKDSLLLEAKGKEQEWKQRVEEDLSPQLTTLKGDLERQQRAVEQAKSDRGIVEREIEEARQKLSDQVASLRMLLNEYRQAEQHWRGREVRARLMPWIAGAGLVLCAVFVGVALLKSMLWGALGLGGSLSLAMLAIRFHQGWESEGRVLLQQEEQLAEHVRQGGVPWRGVEQFETTLEEWQELKKGELDKEQRVAVQKETDACIDLSSLETRQRGLESQLIQAKDQLEQTQTSRKALEGELEGLRKAIQKIRDRCGLPRLEELREKVEEREELERQQGEKETTLKTLTGQNNDNGWRQWLEETSRKLPEELKQDTAATELPALDRLQSELDRLRKDRNDKQEEQGAIAQEARLLREEANRFRARLHPLGVVNAAQVFLGIEEAQERLKQWIKHRLAALWVVGTLERLQQDSVIALERSLERAADIFWGITQYYRKLRYDREEHRFLALKYDGQEFSEEQLGTSARAQLLLAVRLAVVPELLDEPGFLILDDPFLTCDPHRKERAVQQLLRLVEQGWQVFYLTMDPLTRDLFKRHSDLCCYSVTDLCTNIIRS